MPEGLPLSHRPRRNRHLLAMTPERVLTLVDENGMDRNYAWAPVAGKMGWDHWSTKPIFERLGTEKFTAELASAGFGNGNPKAVAVAAKHIQRAVGHLHWH